MAESTSTEHRGDQELPLSGKVAGSGSVRDAAPRRKARRFGPFSSLSNRIMAINLFSLVFLVGGILYLDQFRGGLVEARLQAMSTNGKLIAGALGEAALRDVPYDGQVRPTTLDSRIVKAVLRRLAIVTDTTALLYNQNGDLIADSRLLISSGREILNEPLPPPEAPGNVRAFYEDIYDFLAELIPNSQEYPLFPTGNLQRSEMLDEVGTAVRGKDGSAIRQTRDGTVMLTVALPVEGFKQILGGLLLVEDGNAIDEAVKSAQVTTLIVFSITLVINLLLSLYLARTIARPIHDLAEGADNVRLGLGRRVDIPDFTERQDEIGLLSGSLQNMTEALYDRMDAVESFAADVSHELKNPLTSLGTAVDTFSRIKDEDNRAKLLAVISSDVKRLDRLITDISAASRLDAELSRSEGEPVSIVELIDSVADMYKHGRGPDHISISVETSQQDLKVFGLPGRLGQVLRNLIENAISFSPEGGTVLVRAAEDVDRDGKVWVQIDVEDQGPGIPANKLDSIFNRFYTERPAGEDFGQHSGLGLSISKLIVDAHSGTIRAQNRMSSDGSIIGARFTVRLPA
ncbi:HAMP domain-containing protein [Sneathiella sp. P13V-1]|uniref:stimulus-sensing domain-containing protein n=1 Tax=Sneathiella sp. P13V-1 TaxID=2697366 RepID=UPI00187B1D22|nr:sensor histidine kinase [Sneathiella sp. P13V-1]MBE7636019.1 HAMP domain-containing protein [Sneathiella sp. P13V-1]